MGGVEVSRERVVDFERSNWMQQVASLTQMVAQLQAGNEALQQQEMTSTERINQLLTDLNAARQERDGVTAQLDSANRQVGELQGRLSEAHAEIDELNSPGLKGDTDRLPTAAEILDAARPTGLEALKGSGIKAADVRPIDRATPLDDPDEQEAGTADGDQPGADGGAAEPVR